jgi:hypothetical protein
MIMLFGVKGKIDLTVEVQVIILLSKLKFR